MRILLAVLILCAAAAAASAAAAQPAPLTPPPPAQPRINGPSVFGVRPGAPFIYAVPVTGRRPMIYSADHLPPGIDIDPSTGIITGSIKTVGEYPVVLRAKNDLAAAEKKFRIIAGDRIGLTPAMGWNSWNCWSESVDQDKVLKSARAMVSSGLKDHGWTYINIDDTWQAPRGGAFNGLQGNKKFPDMHGLCTDIHTLGLKAGIYSTPWIASYAGFPGGSADNAGGAWDASLANEKSHRIGAHSFATNDAQQWAAWGFDYLKYDWNPNDLDHIREMSAALKSTGRDMIFSLSNSAPFAEAAELGKYANSWRTSGDIRDRWDTNAEPWNCSVSFIAFSQDPWAPFAGRGYFNDPDMLVVGYVGWGPNLHLTRLTPDEQYTHLTMWCMLSAPLLIGCDMDRLDPFTAGLLTNDEVLAIDQDALAKPATRAATLGPFDIYAKDLEDGSRALAFFNRGDSDKTCNFDKLGWIGCGGVRHVRDLWRQNQLPDVNEKISVPVPAHGAVLLKFTR